MSMVHRLTLPLFGVGNSDQPGGDLRCPSKRLRKNSVDVFVLLRPISILLGWRASLLGCTPLFYRRRPGTMTKKWRTDNGLVHLTHTAIMW